MYEDGHFTNKTAAQIKVEFGDTFAQYATTKINSALQNCCRVKNEVKAKAQQGTAIMNAMSNFEWEGHMGTYVSAEDPDFLLDKDNLSDAVSMFSMNNNASYG
eukprot:4893658-Ditylum_brightwellii.AAC.1